MYFAVKENIGKYNIIKIKLFLFIEWIKLNCRLLFITGGKSKGMCDSLTWVTVNINMTGYEQLSNIILSELLGFSLFYISIYWGEYFTKAHLDQTMVRTSTTTQIWITKLAMAKFDYNFLVKQVMINLLNDPFM